MRSPTGCRIFVQNVCIFTLNWQSAEVDFEKCRKFTNLVAKIGVDTAEKLAVSMAHTDVYSAPAEGATGGGRSSGWEAGWMIPFMSRYKLSNSTAFGLGCDVSTGMRSPAADQPGRCTRHLPLGETAAGHISRAVPIGLCTIEKRKKGHFREGSFSLKV